MCGRYLFLEDDFDMKDFLEEFEWDGTEIKTGEIFPTNIVPILHTSKQQRRLSPVKWGFPRWNSAGVIINARAETALDKGMFRQSLLERRCVVPSSGFYEWQQVEGQKKKDKYHIKMPSGNTLFMAGMWNHFHSPNGEYRAFVILTTDSNSSMAVPNNEISLFPDSQEPIHDRMPVVLMPNELNSWIDDSTFMEQVLRRPGAWLSLSMVSS